MEKMVFADVVKLKLPWISQTGPKSMTYVLIRDRRHRERPCEVGGRDCRDVAIS